MATEGTALKLKDTSWRLAASDELGVTNTLDEQVDGSDLTLLGHSSKNTEVTGDATATKR